MSVHGKETEELKRFIEKQREKNARVDEKINVKIQKALDPKVVDEFREKMGTFF